MSYKRKRKRNWNLILNQTLKATTFRKCIFHVCLLKIGKYLYLCWQVKKSWKWWPLGVVKWIIDTQICFSERSDTKETVTKAVFMKVISSDLVGISLSSSTPKALLNGNLHFSTLALNQDILSDRAFHKKILLCQLSFKWHLRNLCSNYGGRAMTITVKEYFWGIWATPW